MHARDVAGVSQSTNNTKISRHPGVIETPRVFSDEREVRFAGKRYGQAAVSVEIGDQRHMADSSRSRRHST
jgi:hypothetical protein